MYRKRLDFAVHYQNQTVFLYPRYLATHTKGSLSSKDNAVSQTEFFRQGQKPPQLIAKERCFAGMCVAIW